MNKRLAVLAIVMLTLVVSLLAIGPANAQYGFMTTRDETNVTFDLSIGANYYLPISAENPALTGGSATYYSNPFFYVSDDEKKLKVVPAGVEVEYAIVVVRKGLNQVRAYPDNGEGQPEYNFYKDKSLFRVHGGKTRRAELENDQNKFSYRGGAIRVCRETSVSDLGYQPYPIWLNIPGATDIRVRLFGLIQVYRATKPGWFCIDLRQGVEACPYTLTLANVPKIQQWMQDNEVPGRFTDPDNIVFRPAGDSNAGVGAGTSVPSLPVVGVVSGKVQFDLETLCVPTPYYRVKVSLDNVNFFLPKDCNGNETSNTWLANEKVVMSGCVGSRFYVKYEFYDARASLSAMTNCGVEVTVPAQGGCAQVKIGG